MSHDPTVPASALLTLIENVSTHTRPATSAELLQALNFGIGKVVRALHSVRSEALIAFQDPFTIAAGQAEYDMTILAPPFVRPVRLTIPGGTTPSIIFRQRALMDPEYEARDGRQTSSGSGFFYDILTGRLPRTPQQYLSVDLLTGIVTFDSLTDAEIAAAFPIGSLVLLPGATTPNPTDLYTVVTALAGVTLTLATLPTQDSTGYGSVTARAIVPLWERLLRLAPTPATSYQGRLYYNYDPRAASGASFLDPLLTRYQDCIVEYALHHLLKGTADAMHRDHLESANEMRAELMADQDPLSGQNAEALSSGLGDD